MILFNEQIVAVLNGYFSKQLAKTAVLRNEGLLGIIFESGDSLDIETVEGQYESVVFRFPPHESSLVMEIF